MRNFVTKVALGLSIISTGAVVAAPASAGTHRLANAVNRNFFIGVSGGQVNNHVNDGTHLILWQRAGNDQIWNVPDENGGGQFKDFYTDPQGRQVCMDLVGGSSAGAGAALDVVPCLSADDPVEQFWQIISTSKVGFGTQYPGCFIILNVVTGDVAGVQGGDSQVKNGTPIVQWPFQHGTAGNINQFWCEA